VRVSRYIPVCTGNSLWITDVKCISMLLGARWQAYSIVEWWQLYEGSATLRGAECGISQGWVRCGGGRGQHIAMVFFRAVGGGETRVEENNDS
jgi:hypothetical protein